MKAPRSSSRKRCRRPSARTARKCGSGKSKVLSAQIWVTDIRNRAPMNEVWTAWVDKSNLPARACIEAKLADPKALVEIMVVAAK